MEKERGMEEHQATPALQEFPQLRRLPFFSAQNQDLIADYLAHLRARHYAPSMQEATLRALKSFAVLMPKVRQAILYKALTQTCGPQKLHHVLDDILPSCENRRGHSPMLRRMLRR